MPPRMPPGLSWGAHRLLKVRAGAGRESGEGRLMADRLAGKVALVTGAGSRAAGIGNGKATATLFAREGAKVVCVDNMIERAIETVKEIEAEGGTAVAVAADVTNRGDCEQMIDVAIERYGK